MRSVFFHAVESRDYPLFEHGMFPLTLASKMVEVARGEHLDLFHVHYAVPHATAAYLARQVLRREGERAPPIVTTLHGTDITLVGSDPGYLPITRLSIAESDALTAPSEFLREATYERLGLPRSMPIEVIPNFVDTDVFRPTVERRWAALDQLLPRGLSAATLGARPRVLLHNSNFRPVKRVDLVVRIFAEVRRAHPGAVLLLVGDGPDRPRAEALVGELGLSDAVGFLGTQRQVAEALSHADVFLLPSESESFGLAALEAQSAGVPVVASRVGGVPEVIIDGETGLLCASGDVASLAAATSGLLTDEPRHRAMSEAARRRVLAHFPKEPLVDRYEALYRRVLGPR